MLAIRYTCRGFFCDYCQKWKAIWKELLELSILTQHLFLFPTTKWSTCLKSNKMKPVFHELITNAVIFS